MTNAEKAESLKSAISQLYSTEGRSISYISRLLEIDRKTLSIKMRTWQLPEAEPRHHLTPSNQKFMNRNRELIKARLDKDVPVTRIAEELHVTRHMLSPIIRYDDVLANAHKEYQNRCKDRHVQNIEHKMASSRMGYDIEPILDERWSDILGYTGYQVSNAGRIKHYSRRYKRYQLIKSFPNKNNGRLYVMLTADDGTKRNLQVANLVGHAFIPGYDETHCTINHEDGDVTNNWDWNLKWTTQSENNRHAYEKLGRRKVRTRTYEFKRIIYKDQYEFKTVAAFARFLGKSETQVRRYLDEPNKHEIRLVI